MLVRNEISWEKNKCTFNKLTLLYYFNAKECGISNVAKNTSMLPSKISQMKKAS